MNVSFSLAALPTVAADLLVVGVAAGSLPGSLAALDGADGFAGRLGAIVSAEEFTGKAGSLLHVHGVGALASARLLLVGLGAGRPEDLRAAAGVAGTQARQKGARSLALSLPIGDAEALRLVLESVAEGNYRFDKYKSNGKKPALELVTLIGQQEDAQSVAVALATIAGQSLTRDLVNEPAAEIYPETLAAVALAMASDDITVTVLNEDEIVAKGMGGIAGVGQGSARPPRFIHLRYEPKGGAKAHVAVVGKGVTFDSGGLSLKPSDGMQTMRCDMAGAGAVLGLMKAVAALKPDVRVDGIIGAVENMPSGTSYKLGDILKMYNGKRVEIHNTDAEGRLVLADCLTYASELKPDAVVDLATLTGAIVIALGDWYVGMFSRSDDLAGALSDSAKAAGEGVWRMPLPDLYKDKLKAEWGDMKNVGGRAGGSITAALFLSEFVTVEKWAHLDIAGPAFLDSSLQHYVPGGTGVMVRTLTRWVEQLGR